MDQFFFFLSKVFWIVARPDSLLFLLVLLAAILRPRPARAMAGMAAAFMLAVGALPVADWLLHPLERRYAPPPGRIDADGLIVLGGASRGDLWGHWGTPETNEHGERFFAALTLARDNPSYRVVFTGGSGSLRAGVPSEAGSARALLLAGGVRPDRLIVEGRSRNTAENAAFTRDEIGEAEAGTWILVTSAWHMPRAIETFCAAGWRAIVPYPVDHQSLPDRPWPAWSLSERLYQVNIAVKEWIGLLAYRATGRATDAGCVADPAEHGAGRHPGGVPPIADAGKARAPAHGR